MLETIRNSIGCKQVKQQIGLIQGRYKVAL